MSVAGSAVCAYLPIWLDLAQISRTELAGRPRPEFCRFLAGLARGSAYAMTWPADDAALIVPDAFSSLRLPVRERRPLGLGLRTITQPFANRETGSKGREAGL